MHQASDEKGCQMNEKIIDICETAIVCGNIRRGGVINKVPGFWEGYHYAALNIKDDILKAMSDSI
jgi:hypothetical protein